MFSCKCKRVGDRSSRWNVLLLENSVVRWLFCWNLETPWFLKRIRFKHTAQTITIRFISCAVCLCACCLEIDTPISRRSQGAIPRKTASPASTTVEREPWEFLNMSGNFCHLSKGPVTVCDGHRTVIKNLWLSRYNTNLKQSICRPPRVLSSKTN